jgi:hypothetical protein
VSSRLLLFLLVAAIGGNALESSASGEPFEIRFAKQLDLEPRSEGIVSLTIVPDREFSISQDGPVSVRVDRSKSLATGRKKYSRKHAADSRAQSPRFDLKMRSTAQEGRFEVKLDIRFWLCRKQTCRPVRSKHTSTVVVASPPAPESLAPR